MFLLTEEQIYEESIKSFPGECCAIAQLKQVFEVLMREQHGSFHDLDGKVHFHFSQDLLMQLKEEAGL